MKCHSSSSWFCLEEDDYDVLDRFPMSVGLCEVRGICDVELLKLPPWRRSREGGGWSGARAEEGGVRVWEEVASAWPGREATGLSSGSTWRCAGAGISRFEGR